MNARAAFPELAATPARSSARRAEETTATIPKAWRPSTVSLLHGRRLGSSMGLGGAAFLLWYAALHTLHVFALDPPVLTRLVPIPLFGTFLGAAAGALLTGAAVAMSPARHHSSLAAALPRTLGLSIILFAIAVTVLP